MSAGEAHSLAVDADGELYSWGMCAEGRLGLHKAALVAKKTHEPMLAQLKELLRGCYATQRKLTFAEDMQILETYGEYAKRCHQQLSRCGARRRG